MSHTRWMLMLAVGVLSVIGWTMHWHLTVVNNTTSAVKPVLHLPMSAVECYTIAQLRPSRTTLDEYLGGDQDGSGILVYFFDDRACTVDYLSNDRHPSSVSLDLAQG